MAVPIEGTVVHGQLVTRGAYRRAWCLVMALVAGFVGLRVSAASAAGQPVIFAAPDGSPNGDGSAVAPYDLATALSSGAQVPPGGSVMLRGGTYRGTFTSQLTGSASQPITVKSFPGEWAVLDSGTAASPVLSIRGSDTWYRDFEVMKSDPRRVSAQAGPQPTDVSRGQSSPNVLGDGVYDFAPRTKLIDLVVHDAGNGIGFWEGAIDSEIYGCIVFNNGWVGKDRAWGHAIYVQNRLGTKNINDSILFDNFGYGVHGYGQAGALKGIHMNGLTSFENGGPAGSRQANVLVGNSVTSADDIALRNSVLYHRPGGIGYNLRFGLGDLQATAAGSNGTVDAENNYVVGGSQAVFVRDWKTAILSHNVFVARPNSDGSSSYLVGIEPPIASDGVAATSTYNWNANTYNDGNRGLKGALPRSFGLNRWTRQSSPSAVGFSSWAQTTLFDKSSRYVQALPSAPVVFVRPNAYEPGRANVAIFNWQNALRVAVDLSSTDLVNGQHYEVKDVQNLAGPPVVWGYYTGQPIWVPMTNTTVTPPIGLAANSVPHTPAEFSVFVVYPR